MFTFTMTRRVLFLVRGESRTDSACVVRSGTPSRGGAAEPAARRRQSARRSRQCGRRRRTDQHTHSNSRMRHNITCITDVYSQYNNNK